jgi:hypothetical protein
MRASQERGVQHAWQYDIVDITTAPGEHSLIFYALNAGTYGSHTLSGS